MTGYAIVLASGDVARVQAASIIGSVAAASDVPVEVFVTMDGLTAFESERVESGAFEGGEVAAAMAADGGEKMDLYYEQLADAKDIGPLSVYACEMAMDLFGTDLDDYVDVFDDTLGVAGFLNRAADKQVVFV
jgi:peroxiredoxin family protein